MKNNELSAKLNSHYKEFDKSSISPDPLEMLHHYRDKRDIELMGILSSIFAYGSVKQILKTLYAIEKIMEFKPYEFILNYNKEIGKSVFHNIRYRFYSSEDVVNLFGLLAKGIREYDTLENLFQTGFSREEKNVKIGINNFSEWFIGECRKSGCLTNGITFMFPKPEKGSAAKRMNLFLRWMVRKDELDFGLWNGIAKSQLVIPVDTHIARISKALGLTTLKNVSWKMAEEITENLKQFDSEDPVKFDFALCHIGMRKMEF
jgi:uncharacterized protein (TIGR02757 family)